jgi:hypothetical protein
VWAFLPLELIFSGQQRLCVIRVRASVPRIILFGQQRLYVIRVRALVPRIILSRPAAPLRYSTAGFGPSSYFLWASSASELLEHGLRSLRTLSSSRQCFRKIRVQFSRPAVPSKHSSSGFSPSNLLLRAGSASTLFGLGCPNPRNASPCRWCPHFVRIRADALSNLSFGLSTLLIQHARILVAIYQFGCRMSNTKVSPRFATPDGPVFVSNALCRKFSIPTV